MGTGHSKNPPHFPPKWLPRTGACPEVEELSSLSQGLNLSKRLMGPFTPVPTQGLLAQAVSAGPPSFTPLGSLGPSPSCSQPPALCALSFSLKLPLLLANPECQSTTKANLHCLDDPRLSAPEQTTTAPAHTQWQLPISHSPSGRIPHCSWTDASKIQIWPLTALPDFQWLSFDPRENFNSFLWFIRLPDLPSSYKPSDFFLLTLPASQGVLDFPLGFSPLIHFLLH